MTKRQKDQKESLMTWCQCSLQGFSFSFRLLKYYERHRGSQWNIVKDCRKIWNTLGTNLQLNASAPRIADCPFVLVCVNKLNYNWSINNNQALLLVGIPESDNSHDLQDEMSQRRKKPWTCLPFVVVKVARGCGVKRGERRKVRWGRVFAWAGRSWTDMSVPVGSEPNTIMEMYLPFVF